YPPEEAGILDGLANAYVYRYYHAREAGARGRDEDLQHARELLQQAIALRPTVKRGYFPLGELAVGERQPRRALELARRGLEAPGADLEGWIFYGRALSMLGRHEEAIAAYRKYLEVRSSAVVAWLNMGNSYSRLGNWSEAQACFRRVLELDPDH